MNHGKVQDRERVCLSGFCILFGQRRKNLLFGQLFLNNEGCAVFIGCVCVLQCSMLLDLDIRCLTTVSNRQTWLKGCWCQKSYTVTPCKLFAILLHTAPYFRRSLRLSFVVLHFGFSGPICSVQLLYLAFLLDRAFFTSHVSRGQLDFFTSDRWCSCGKCVACSVHYITSLAIGWRLPLPSVVPGCIDLVSSACTRERGHKMDLAGSSFGNRSLDVCVSWMEDFWCCVGQDFLIVFMAALSV